MTCPNCGTEQSSEAPAACSSCAMPLADVAASVARYREAVPAAAPAPRIPKERLIGAAAFLAAAAIPIGLGVKNALTARRDAER